MVKCKFCDKEARWHSNKYESPLCSDCARIVVDRMITDGQCDPDETAVIDYFVPIDVDLSTLVDE